MAAEVGNATSRRSLNPRLRPVGKVLPAHARAHNRSLVLQYLFREGPTSRADLARVTALTRVTVSDLISGLMAEGLVDERGIRPGQRVGKPATLVGLRSGAFQIVSAELSDGAMRGAVLTLDGEFVVRRHLRIEGRTGADLVNLLTRFLRGLVSVATAPVIGVGIGVPGLVDDAGNVLDARNLHWRDVPLGHQLRERLGRAVYVAGDAATAVLGEFTFGRAGSTDLMVLSVGEGVGAGIIVDGARIVGHEYAAGEIGHLTVLEDGAECACGRRGCLETVLAAPALRSTLLGLTELDRSAALSAAGQLLGIAVAPVVSALDLTEVVLSGPTALLDGPLRDATDATIRARVNSVAGSVLTVRMATLEEDVGLAGAAALVLFGQLGIS